MRIKNNKSEHLQIRITAEAKKKLFQLAKVNNMTLSEWILSKLSIENSPYTIQSIYEELSKKHNQAFAYVQLHDLLMKVSPQLWDDFVSIRPHNLECETMAYTASMIERAAQMRGLTQPPWIREVETCSPPYFATNLQTLRLYLLINSPVAFRKRNIFIDSSTGDRV